MLYSRWNVSDRFINFWIVRVIWQHQIALPVIDLEMQMDFVIRIMLDKFAGCWVFLVFIADTWSEFKCDLSPPLTDPAVVGHVHVKSYGVTDDTSAASRILLHATQNET